MKIARVGVFVNRRELEDRWKRNENFFPLYIEEIFRHAGIPFEFVNEPVGKEARERWDVMIVLGDLSQGAELDGVREYVRAGGHLISYGGLTGLVDELEMNIVRMKAGYAALEPEDQPLRFVQAELWKQRAISGCRIEGYGNIREQPNEDTLGPALVSFAYGKGRIDRWAVNIPTTVVALQQGQHPVYQDGKPAPDGTAAIDEGILKADDGMVLDWQWDRIVDGRGMPYFPYPFADWWREALVRHVLQLVTEHGKTLPFVDYWPDGVEAIAMISHDSDLNREEDAETTLGMLDELQIKSTWCMLEPGYSQDMMSKIQAKEHELALHYNALEMEGKTWDAVDFARQARWLMGVGGVSEIVSNKNHYTCFEGWDDLFIWCEDNDILSDQTRGPSKIGNIGFLFGTSRPYLPISWFHHRNRLLNVLEIGFLTQDIGHPDRADFSVIEPLLNQVKRVRGVAHFLFHQVCLNMYEGVREGMRKLVHDARSSGFVFWTGKQINDWERARRSVKLSILNGAGCLRLESDNRIESLVLWVPLTKQEKEQDCTRMDLDEEVRLVMGVACRKVAIGEWTGAVDVDISGQEVNTSRQ
ncbi:hypothetical protein [Paenibacillus nasutitermitis]|uniref:Uncharacterized protein n=1 Tax=Paenibacillus nasutitermitis TaxID=1652958 RepID=A0A916YNT0_9BACL|nr:hypothetical protein [Paenibacillus nasutitermitis]GGD52855.1 hypothetical protein GCM10010911_08040 [Paenibacillus nasutitermitis]